MSIAIVAALWVLVWAVAQFMAWAVAIAFPKGPLAFVVYGFFAYLAMRVLRVLAPYAWDWIAGHIELATWRRRRKLPYAL